MSRTTDIVVSIILGVGLSALFKVCCDSRSCLVYRAPLLEEKIIRYDNKCYAPKERAETCDSKKIRVDVNE
jgi:hypothetical protein